MHTSDPLAPSALSKLGASPIDDSQLFEELRAALAPSFVLIRQIGAGGMGRVYLARDPALKRLVAVKLLSPERAVDPLARARFEREAEAVAAISHPNVVAVHSVGALASGIPFMVMQYVEGPSMHERLTAEGPLHLEETKQIIGQVASALAAAHRKGIVHRDIKAANILWDDAASRALVSDFGIAAVSGEAAPDSSRITQTGTTIGTPAYMSPEQFLGEEVTEKTDMYSLGLLGYELLTGEGPYDVSSPRHLPAAHLSAQPRALLSLRPDVDAELDSLLRQCLEKNPDDRPTAEDLSRRLAHGASVLLEWPPPGLESIHGALHRPAALLNIAGVVIAISFLLAAAVPETSMFRLAWPQMLLLPLAGSAGFVCSLAAMTQLEKLAGRAVRGARAGYGWGTIAEVLADERRDTGALICGEREYASLVPARRDTFRRYRVIGQFLRVAAGIWSSAGILIALPLALRVADSPMMLALLWLGVPVLMHLAVSQLESVETRTLAKARERLGKASHLDRMATLVSTWRESFEQAIGGLRRGQGFFGKTRLMKVAWVAVSTAVSAAVLVTMLASTTPVLPQLFADFLMPPEARLTAEYADAQVMARYRIAPDPAITPLKAGQALHVLSASWPTHHPTPAEAPPLLKLANLRAPTVGWGPFTGNWRAGFAIAQAAKGLNARQRSFLLAEANQPGVAQFETLSLARDVDFIGASVIQPLPRHFEYAMIPRLETRELQYIAQGRVARAALDLADGNPAAAEWHLREIITVGLTLMKTPSVAGNLAGTSLVRLGRANLIALLEVTGRAGEAGALTSTFREKESLNAFDSDLRLSPSDRARHRNALLRDSSVAPSLRWDIVTRRMAFEPCTDLRQMLFGPGAEHLAAMEKARGLMVKFPGDEILMHSAEDALNSPSHTSNPFLAPPGFLTLSKVLDAVSGSHRFVACMTKADALY